MEYDTRQYRKINIYMKTFIELHRISGDRLLLDVDCIHAVFDREGESSTLINYASIDLIVVEHYDDIVNALKNVSHIITEESYSSPNKLPELNNQLPKIDKRYPNLDKCVLITESSEDLDD